MIHVIYARVLQHRDVYINNSHDRSVVVVVVVVVVRMCLRLLFLLLLLLVLCQFNDIVRP